MVERQGTCNYMCTVPVVPRLQYSNQNEDDTTFPPKTGSFKSLNMKFFENSDTTVVLQERVYSNRSFYNFEN